jgi:hypothetical protein
MKSDEGAYSRAVADMSPRAIDAEHRASCARPIGGVDGDIVLDLRAE